MLVNRDREGNLILDNGERRVAVVSPAEGGRLMEWDEETDTTLTLLEQITRDYVDNPAKALVVPEKFLQLV